MGGIGVAGHKHNVIPPQLRYAVGAAGYKPRHLRDAMPCERIDLGAP